MNKQKTQLEKEEIDMKYKIEWYKANTDREYKEDMVKEAKRRTEVELAQLTDGNPYNDTIRKLGNGT
ncbi:MAG: hypothetical protein LUC37_03075 [Prevotella sp.]|nr:hypothetical protein [Prevotella sp.]